jgi:hypothetical protein
MAQPVPIVPTPDQEGRRRPQPGPDEEEEFPDPKQPVPDTPANRAMENLVLETEFLEDVADGEVVVDEIPFSEPIVEPPELEEGEEAPPLPPLIPQGFAGVVSNLFGMQFQRRAWCTFA